MKLRAGIKQLALLGLVFSCAACAEQTGETAPEVQAKSVFPISESFLADHPSKIWMEAASLIEAGDMENAAIWFYAGQLRYRVLLECPAQQAAPQDLIVFSAQFETMEPRVNGWAARHLGEFVTILDDVLAWDEANAANPASYAQCQQERAEVRATFETIREQARSATETP